MFSGVLLKLFHGVSKVCFLPFTKYSQLTVDINYFANLCSYFLVSGFLVFVFFCCHGIVLCACMCVCVYLFMYMYIFAGHTDRCTGICTARQSYLNHSQRWLHLAESTHWVCLGEDRLSSHPCQPAACKLSTERFP